MSSNKRIHTLLAQIYGNKCMFIEAHLEDIHFRRYVKQKHYSSRELTRLKHNLTVHHLKHKSEGGKSDVENCSLVNELAHRYLHQLPRDIEELYNNAIREWKEARVVQGDVELPFEINMAQMSIDHKGNMKLKRLKQEEKRKEKTEMQRIKKYWEDR